jgi:thiamine biosynthesis lipoprotein
MKSFSDNLVVERAQPWLGTLVSIRVEGLPVSRAHRAIDAAFAEVGTVHRLMSFHQEESDVSRLNRHAVRKPVAVHSHTLEVLKCALAIAACSYGVFDISVGAELVKWGLLPRPAGAPHSPKGSWRDIELRQDDRVAFHRPLWIDLGGIAKGYAVDRATKCLCAWGAEQVVVNAGGDLRVHGPRAEHVGLKLEALVDPVGRNPAPTDRFVCVVAEGCVVADALTKVVMADGPRSVDLLRKFGASAHLHDPLSGWQHLDGGRKHL